MGFLFTFLMVSFGTKEFIIVIQFTYIFLLLLMWNMHFVLIIDHLRQTLQVFSFAQATAEAQGGQVICWRPFCW